jgi:pyruvate formate lyase activating enzyme
MQGCNMHCGYCHNPETRGLCVAGREPCDACLDACPEGALSRNADGSIAWDAGRCASCDRCIAACPHDASPRALRLEPAELAARIAPLEPFIDGVTFSGGECCIQGAFLLESAALIRALRGDLVVIADTNGAVTTASFAPLLRGLDGFIFDLKAWDEATHLGLTGIPRDGVLRNMSSAAKVEKLVEVRTVLIEGINDGRDELLASARFLSGLGGNFPWRLLPFRPQGVRGRLAAQGAYPRAAFEAALEIARSVIGVRAIGPAVAP